MRTQELGILLPLYRYRVTGTASCSLPGWGSEPADQVATGGSACDNGTAVQPSSWAKRRKDRSSETSLHPDAHLRPPHSLTRNRVTSPAVTPAHPVPPAGTAEPTNKPATPIRPTSPAVSPRWLTRYSRYRSSNASAGPAGAGRTGSGNDAQADQVIQQARAARRGQLPVATFTPSAQEPRGLARRVLMYRMSV